MVTRMRIVSAVCLLALLAGGARAGLIGYWDFDDGTGGTATDKGGANNGTVNGATWVPGQPGYGTALDFNGTSNSVTTALSLSGMGQFSHSGWVKPNLQGGNRVGLWGQNDAIEFGLINPNQLQQWTPGGGAINLGSPFTMPATDWHHVAVVGDGTAGGLRMYVDGAERTAGGSNTGDYGTSGSTFNIGGSGIFDGGGNWYSGQIDDVAVFDAPLGLGDLGLLGAGLRKPNTLPASSKGISINFSTRNGGTNHNVTSPTGVFEMGNWNNAASDSSGDGTMPNLVDSSGAATTATVTWQSNNNWFNGAWDENDGGIGSMMATYLDTGNGGASNGANIRLTGLPAELAAGFDVLVYFDGDGSNRFGDYTVSDGTKTVTLVGNDPGNDLGSYVFDDGTSADNGNFLLFEDFSGDTLTISSAATQGFRAPINGIQLVQRQGEGDVPEPVTMALLGLATCGLGGYIRRRRRV